MNILFGNSKMRVFGGWVACLAAPIIVGMNMTGWFSNPQSWEQATGWQEIPTADRPRASSLAEIFGASEALPEIQWLGHAGFIVRWWGETILLDPNVSRRCTVSTRRLDGPGVGALPDVVDAALISHAHYDHLDLPTLRAIRHVRQLVVPAGSEIYLDAREWPETALVGMARGGTLPLGKLEIVAVPADHQGNRFHPLQSAHLAHGYIIRDGVHTIYFAGDTSARNDFAGIRRWHHPDIAILPIGAYAPGIPLKYYHLSPEEAVQVGLDLGVSVVIPCHFGTFRVSWDRPQEALPRFARAAHDHGLNWLMPRLPDREHAALAGVPPPP